MGCVGQTPAGPSQSDSATCRREEVVVVVVVIDVVCKMGKETDQANEQLQLTRPGPVQARAGICGTCSGRGSRRSPAAPAPTAFARSRTRAH